MGNIVCGLLGALPTTGVITRSSANVQAGAKRRAAVVMTGAQLLVIMAAVPTAFRVIPRASLAGLLVYIGYKLVRGRPLAELRHYGRSEMAIFGVTVAIIVGVNLLTGIVVGILLAAGKVILAGGEQFHELRVETSRDAEARQTHVHLRGAASFLRLPRLAARLEQLPLDEEVHLHVEQLESIDHACIDLLTTWERGRMRMRAPVRVQWKTLHHRYHDRDVLDSTPKAHSRAPSRERLLDFLEPRAILIAPELRDKWHAIEVLSSHLTKLHGLERDTRGIIESVKTREHEATTCIGHGLMIPHGTLTVDQPLLGVMALSEEGWDFGAPDGERVRCIVLLATPESEAPRHLAVLAAFARLFLRAPELRAALLAAQSGEETHALLNGPDAETVNYAFESRKRAWRGAAPPGLGAPAPLS